MTTSNSTYFLVNNMDFAYLRDASRSLDIIQKTTRDILDRASYQPINRPIENTVAIGETDIKAIRLAWTQLSDDITRAVDALGDTSTKK